MVFALKKISALCFALSLGISLMAGNIPERRYGINLKPNSYLLINGTTNIGGFICQFNMSILTDSLELNARQDSNGCLNFEKFSLILPVQGFDCGNSQMNSDFQKLLEFHENPDILWRILCIDMNSLTAINTKKLQNLQLQSQITIAGVNRDYWLTIQVKKINQQLYFAGQLPINIRDFNLEPPRKFFGLVEVKPEIVIDFSMELSVTNP